MTLQPNPRYSTLRAVTASVTAQLHTTKRLTSAVTLLRKIRRNIDIYMRTIHDTALSIRISKLNIL